MPLKGVLELAAAGVSLSIFNVTSKLFNIPLLSVATSFVAEDISQSLSNDSTSGKISWPWKIGYLYGMASKD